MKSFTVFLNEKKITLRFIFISLKSINHILIQNRPETMQKIENRPDSYIIMNNIISTYQYSKKL